MQQNMVSIIVPVYNAGNYIEETIRMVEAQTYQDWELLLIDDCSVDNSRAVIEAYIRERGQKLSSEGDPSDPAYRERRCCKDKKYRDSRSTGKIYCVPGCR